MSIIIISLIGKMSDVEQASKEIEHVANENGVSHKMLSITPTILAHERSNMMPKWRKELKNELFSAENLLINKIKHANCDAITDLNRSIRSLDLVRHPIVFEVVDDNEMDYYNKNSFDENCGQITSKYFLKNKYNRKKDMIERYLK